MGWLCNNIVHHECTEVTELENDYDKDLPAALPFRLTRERGHEMPRATDLVSPGCGPGMVYPEFPKSIPLQLFLPSSGQSWIPSLWTPHWRNPAICNMKWCVRKWRPCLGSQAAQGGCWPTRPGAGSALFLPPHGFQGKEFRWAGAPLSTDSSGWLFSKSYNWGPQPLSHRISLHLVRQVHLKCPTTNRDWSVCSPGRGLGRRKRRRSAHTQVAHSLEVWWSLLSFQTRRSFLSCLHWPLNLQHPPFFLLSSNRNRSNC